MINSHPPGLTNQALARLIGGHVCMHACMAGMRMVAPLLALRAGYSAAVVVSDGTAQKRRAWDLLRQGAMRRLLLVNWLMSSCWDVHTFVVPVLGHERGLSASAIGAILGGFALAATGIRVALPWLAANVQERKVITSAMLATAGLFALYPFMHSALGMGLCSAALGISLGSVQPMIMSTLHQITPEARHGETLGLRLMLINASSVGMPMLLKKFFSIKRS